MEIRRGTAGDLDGFCQLWKSCFGEDEEYLSFYLAHAYRPERVWYYLEDGRPASMLTLLPCTEYAGGREAAGSYVYAVATLPEYRRRGMMTMLHQAAEADCRQRGNAFLALVPAEPSLFPMYEKLGYRTCTSLWYHTLDPEEWQRSSRKTIFFGTLKNDFLRMREKYLHRQRSALFLSDDLTPYTFDELAEAGYAVRTLKNELGSGYLVYRRVEGSGLLIRETNLERRCFQAAIYSLGRLFDAKTIFLKAAHAWFTPSERRPYGMMKRLDDGHIRAGCYMNLMLDD